MVVCVLCGKLIDKYNPVFNQLVISDSRSVDLCQNCIDKFLKWQRELLKKLFPTSVTKRGRV